MKTTFLFSGQFLIANVQMFITQRKVRKIHYKLIHFIPIRENALRDSVSFRLVRSLTYFF